MNENDGCSNSKVMSCNLHTLKLPEWLPQNVKHSNETTMILKNTMLGIFIFKTQKHTYILQQNELK